MKHARAWFALCVVWSSVACQRRAAPQPSKPAVSRHAPLESPREPEAPHAEPSASTCLTPLEPLSELRLKATIESWQRAQRQADFARYEEFYGARFSGLLDTGSGLARLNRADWLSRKRASFGTAKAPAGTPQIALGAGGARVRVDHDELFIVANQAGPKIVWQTPVLPRPVPLQAAPGLWLADEEGALLSATPDPNWATGAPTLVGTERARRSVRIERLPAALRAWLGRPVRVLGASGAMCETRLQRFVMSARITPDLRTAEHWEGCADGPPIAPESIAADIWRLSANGGQALLAEFQAPCKGALLAIDPDTTPPPIAAPQPPSAEVGTRLSTAFRELPEYARIQSRYRAEHPDAEGSWDDHDARRSLSTLALPGLPPFYFVSVEVGACCEGFSAGLSAVWPSGLEGPGQAVTPLDSARVTPSALLQLPDSSSVLLLGPDGLFRARSLLRREPGGSRYLRELSSAVPFFAGEG